MNTCPDCEGKTTVAWTIEERHWGRDLEIFSSIVPIHTCLDCKRSYTDCVADEITTFDQFILEQSKGIIRTRFWGIEEELWERAKNAKVS